MKEPPTSGATRYRRRPPLVGEIARELFRRIRGNSAGAGSTLPPERELAADLGVSRPVVREALQRLQSRGLVEIRHGVGVRVTDRVHQPVAEALDSVMPEGRLRLLQLVEARLLLEPHVAAKAAQRGSGAILRRLAVAQNEMRSAEPHHAIEFDMQFHRLLAQAAGNSALLLMLDALADLGRQSRQLTMALPGGVERAWRQHEAIHAAVQQRDPAAAADAMKMHIQASASDLGSRRRGLRS